MPAKIIDEFTDLPVSRQRKAQLRWHRDGRCVDCGRPRVNATYCEQHRRRHAATSREHMRRRLGLKGRYAAARSYAHAPAPPPPNETKPPTTR